MEYISIICVIISAILCVLTFFFNRSDKNNKDTKDDGYKWGQVEEKLSNIEKVLAKIETKLDVYDRELDERIDKKIHDHVEMYHKETK